MDGVLISLIDLYYNLKRYIDVDICIVTEYIESCINHLFKNNNSDLVNKICTDVIFEREMIICSTRFLYDEICKLKCNKLIILDSLDLSKSIYGVHPSILQFLPPDLNSEQVIFLSNHANIMKNCIYQQIPYYQKLNEYRLNNHPYFYGRYVGDYSLKKKYFHDIYNYRRTDKKYCEIKRNFYFENFGRMIFEHIYIDKLVNYYIDGLVKKDGLYYYLKLFGVDGFLIHTPLPIDKIMIEEVLFMKDNDPILTLL
jgi:hypothetical protein